MRWRKQCVIVCLYFSIVLIIIYSISQANVQLKLNVQLESRPYLPLFQYEEVIKHCITGRKIGQLPANFTSSPIHFSKTSTLETAEKRNKSFHQVFHSKEWGGGAGEEGDHQIRASGYLQIHLFTYLNSSSKLMKFDGTNVWWDKCVSHQKYLMGNTFGLFAHAYADDLQSYCPLSPREEQVALQHFRSCWDSVSRWMYFNRLKLIPSKGGLIWLFLFYLF